MNGCGDNIFRSNNECCCKSRALAGALENPQRYGLLIITDAQYTKEEGDLFWKESKLPSKVLHKMIKRLLIKASNNYDSDYQVVPVNTRKPIDIDSDIGVFSLIVNVRNFDGCNEHRLNSTYNIGDEKYLNGSLVDDPAKEDPLYKANLRLEVSFRPKRQIKGSELLFGNDFTVPIKSYVPTSLLSTGLKFFTYFINKTIKGEIYGDKPYLYGLALNSFTYMSLNHEKKEYITLGVKGTEKGEADTSTGNDNGNNDGKENLNSNEDNTLKIPSEPTQRKRFFNNVNHCESFVFNDTTNYVLQFDTSYLKMADSKYSVSIPTFGNKSFDIDVSNYANDELNNFNWVIKQGGYEGVGHGTLGLVVNFALVNEN